MSLSLIGVCFIIRNGSLLKIEHVLHYLSAMFGIALFTT